MAACLVRAKLLPGPISDDLLLIGSFGTHFDKSEYNLTYYLVKDILGNVNWKMMTNLSRSQRVKRIIWWRHQMETFSAILAICAGNSPVTGESPHKGHAVTRSFDGFFDLRLNKNGGVNNREAGDLRRHCTHNDVTAMILGVTNWTQSAGSYWQGCLVWSHVTSVSFHMGKQSLVCVPISSRKTPTYHIGNPRNKAPWFAKWFFPGIWATRFSLHLWV